MDICVLERYLLHDYDHRLSNTVDSKILFYRDISNM